jgi:DNA-binding protein YbaB
VEQQDLSGLRAYANSLTAQVKGLRQQLATMQGEINAITGVVKSRDGLITATVGPRGQLVKLQLDPRIYRNQDAGALASAITETVHQAAKQAAEKTEAIAAKYSSPDIDLKAALTDDAASRLSRFDFVVDQVEGKEQWRS